MAPHKRTPLAAYQRVAEGLRRCLDEVDAASLKLEETGKTTEAFRGRIAANWLTSVLECIGPDLAILRRTAHKDCSPPSAGPMSDPAGTVRASIKQKGMNAATRRSTRST
jgi:hypothetical protein